MHKMLKKAIKTFKKVGLSPVYDENSDTVYCYGTLVCCWNKVGDKEHSLIISFDLRTPPELSAVIAAMLVENRIPICVNRSVFFDPINFVLTDQMADEAYTNFMRQQIQNIDNYLEEQKPKYLM